VRNGGGGFWREASGLSGQDSRERRGGENVALPGEAKSARGVTRLTKERSRKGRGGGGESHLHSAAETPVQGLRIGIIDERLKNGGCDVYETSDYELNLGRED